jgi:hypothetical protein
LKAFLARRSVLMRVGTGLRIVGSRHSQDALRLTARFTVGEP